MPSARCSLHCSFHRLACGIHFLFLRLAFLLCTLYSFTRRSRGIGILEVRDLEGNDSNFKVTREGSAEVTGRAALPYIQEFCFIGSVLLSGMSWMSWMHSPTRVLVVVGAVRVCIRSKPTPEDVRADMHRAVPRAMLFPSRARVRRHRLMEITVCSCVGARLIIAGGGYQCSRCRHHKIGPKNNS